MAIEALPTTATMSLTNLMMASGVSIGNATAEQRYHGAENLLSPLRGDVWRMPVLTAESVDVDLGASYSPGVAGGIRLFGLVNYNGWPNGFTVTLSSITGIGGTVVNTWSYTTYITASINRIMRFFIGNHDGGALGAASRYWRLGLPIAFAMGGDYPKSFDSFTQVGNLWLGDYVEIGYDKGATITLIDPSIQTKSRAGATFVDRLWPFHEVDLKVPLIPASILYPTLKEVLDVAGGATRMFLDMHSHETADYWRAHGAYYGLLDPKKGSKQTLSFSLYGDLALSFNEDPA